MNDKSLKLSYDCGYRDGANAGYRLAKDEMKAEKLLKNLLAVIHRDGGHYVVENGIEKAVEAAHTVIAKYRTDLVDSSFKGRTQAFIEEFEQSTIQRTREAIRDALKEASSMFISTEISGTYRQAANIAMTAKIDKFE